MILRPYQSAAVAALYEHLRTRDDHPCIVIPTAGGKTPIIGTICRDAVAWGGRVLVLAHVKELLEQSVEKIRTVAPELALSVGVYSAGLKSRDTEHPIIVAGIQSVHRRACDLEKFDLILIDEAHLIQPAGEGMYRSFLADAATINPNVRRVGLTATPYRMGSGSICGPDHLLNHVCYSIGVKELIVQGFLCPLKTRAGSQKIDTSELHVRAGEFVAGEVDTLMDQTWLVRAACTEIIELTQDRKSCLIFACGVDHAQHVRETLEGMGHECGIVTGETLDFDRAATLQRFKNGKLKFLVNINVLTTGFDAPNVDCVVLLRPTNSPGLYYQMVGRGFRLHPGKQDCMVLDFGQNVMRHGPVDMIQPHEKKKGAGEAPVKECEKCHALVAAGYTICPQCGEPFPPPDKQQHSPTASDKSILSGQIEDVTCDVLGVGYGVHEKRNAPPGTPKTMEVEYRIGLGNYVKEWVCFEHPKGGFARRKAEDWWRARSTLPVPDSAAEAVEASFENVLAVPSRITVRTTAGEHFPRIIHHELPEPGKERCPHCDGTNLNADARAGVIWCGDCEKAARLIPKVEERQAEPVAVAAAASFGLVGFNEEDIPF